MSVDWGLAGSVILTGLALVFAILLILIFAVQMTSRIVNSAVKTVPEAKAAAAQDAPKAAAFQAPAVETGIEEETVAAIMAAVSCMAGTAAGTQYAVKSINRAADARPVWGFAGMQQNTRPF